jgi:hypothetical protein
MNTIIELKWLKRVNINTKKSTFFLSQLKYAHKLREFCELKIKMNYEILQN